jgi:hypothetical protein
MLGEVIVIESVCFRGGLRASAASPLPTTGIWRLGLCITCKINIEDSSSTLHIIPHMNTSMGAKASKRGVRQFPSHSAPP